MKLRTTTALAAAMMLIVGSGMAAANAAQPMNSQSSTKAPSQSSTRSSTQTSPQSSAQTPSKQAAASTPQALNLTSDQQQDITKSVKGARQQVAPANFQASVGEKVPSSIKLHTMSKTARREVPAVKSYDFAMLKGELLIVNPKTRTIADVIQM